jgi:alkanesulfonate monooxygenase SsuD/methylene tetrahydromethanopterin reductase-like flavin-dependent oxidoreductase (luciferase family)
MKFGFVIPFADARQAAELARLGENAGWDGFFVSDPLWGVDAWVSLTTAAMLTERIRLGTMLTPIARMRPWRLAGQTAALDNLSGGRVILSVGLGAPDTGYAAFGEVTDRKTRAELTDESLEILTRLWRGQPFSFKGKHYDVRDPKFFPPPPPLQKPRIPIWMVGAWPSPKSMERALRYDGLLPMIVDRDATGNRMPRQALPEELHDISSYVGRVRRENGLSATYDIIVEGETPGNDAEAAAMQLLPWQEAGATWWIESNWNAPSMKVVQKRIEAGPPGNSPPGR